MKKLRDKTGMGRRVRWAVMGLAVAAGLLVMAPSASAAVTAAPTITAQPSNPNTTTGIVKFEYQVGPGETSPVTPLRFYCRQYPTATPPAPTVGWVACGLTSAAPPYARSYSPPNGSQTFEVAVRETTAIGTQGPISTYVWDQNVPVPTQAPAITAKPNDPNTTAVTNEFTFTGGTGETGLPSLFQCSLDGAAFTQCNSGTITYSAGNGEHNFRVQAGTAPGYGPVAEYTWTNDIATPQPSISVEEAATTVYSGAGTNSRIGRAVANLGDVNGDGTDDLGIPSGGTTNPGVYIQFTPAAGRGSTSLTSTLPQYGYRIAPTTGTAVVNNAGDQNGDGTPDQLVTFGSGNSLYVVYGIEDPSDLPVCASGPPSRCLDPSTMTSDQGFRLVDSEGISLGNENLTAAMNFDGSGPMELVLSSNSVNELLIIKGGARVGPVDIATLPASEMLTISNASPEGGTRVTPIDDLNGDGKEDLGLAGVSAIGGSKVLYGFAWTEATLDLTTFDPAMGIQLATPGLALAAATNTGDLNGDGRDDLTVGSRGLLDPNGGAQSYLYLPEPGTGGTLPIAAGITEGNGYYATGGALPSGIGGVTVPVGDLNGDGLEDMYISASTTAVDGVAGVGAAYVVFGQATAPEGRLLKLGADLTPEAGIALLGSGANVQSGDALETVGDIDGDGLTDLVYASTQADPDGVSNAGTLAIVLGKSLINQAKTGNAVGVTDTTASINGSVSTNGRDSEAHFEYGKTDEYGQTTATQELEGSGSGSPVDAELTGLTKATEYHYRVVSTNSLGVTRFGEDKVFTTKSEGTDGNPCEMDDTKPGCAGWCKAHPDECRDKAVLTKLVVNPKTLKVKRGKKGTVTTVLTNVGGKAAEKVKICVKAPKKLVKVKRCKTIGKISPKATRVTSFTVTVKKKAKKGKKINLALKATSGNAGSKSGKATIRVK